MLTLQIRPEAWQKLRGFVTQCKLEISGLGKIEVVDGELYMVDVMIFTQEVGAAVTKIEAEAFAKFHYELVQRGESPADWWCWWHSHATMGTFYSATDIETVEESTDFPHLLSLVTNHAGDFTARYDIYEPVHVYTDVEVVVSHELPEEVQAECLAEIEERVTEIKPINTGFKKILKPYSLEDTEIKDADYYEKQAEEYLINKDMGDLHKLLAQKPKPGTDDYTKTVNLWVDIYVNTQESVKADPTDKKSKKRLRHLEELGEKYNFNYEI